MSILSHCLAYVSRDVHDYRAVGPNQRVEKHFIAQQLLVVVVAVLGYNRNSVCEGDNHIIKSKKIVTRTSSSAVLDWFKNASMPLVLQIKKRGPDLPKSRRGRERVESLDRGGNDCRFDSEDGAKLMCMGGIAIGKIQSCSWTQPTSQSTTKGSINPTTTIITIKIRE